MPFALKSDNVAFVSIRWMVMLAAFTAYVRFVSNTSSWATASTDHFANVTASQPFILALWHGQTMLMPEVLRNEIKPLRAIVANTFVAEPLARALQRMGIGVIRGAGRNWRGQDRGGARALRAAVRSLAEGSSVAMTADLLIRPRRCGLGIVTLARLSRRPIVPVAIASSRYQSLATPNRYTINFPFSQIGMVVGDPIFVPRDAKAEELVHCRERVESALNDVTRQAYAQVGRTWRTRPYVHNGRAIR
jgi:lysophospholipid acyltransferase (LPLAT)-like uncharacterized protein